MSTRGSSSAAWATLALYALTHSAVDAVGAGVLWTAVHDGAIASGTAWSVFLIYNLLAFAIQPMVGLVVDRLGAARGTAALGGLMTAAVVPLSVVPHGLFAAVGLAGLGNAVFHVGGGAASLRFAPGRATPPGVFVAPGAAGLAWGIVIGRGGGPVWPFAGALTVMAVAILARSVPVMPRGVTVRARREARPAIELILLLLLFVVCVRSYVGLALAFPWKSQMHLLVALTAAVVLGKAFGGVLADRLGWRRVGVGALLVSLPLLALGTGSPAEGVAGALVFNMTMPVTLAAAGSLLPRHEGFAFGLTCLALFGGAAPVLLGWTASLSALPLVLAAVPAAIALWFGLGRLLGEARAPEAGIGLATTERGYS